MAESKAREARAPWCQVLVGVVFTSGLIAAPSLVSANEAPRPQHAKQHFGYAAGGSPNRPAALGFYTNGCLAGGVALPVTGRSWEALRVWRNRHWGHPKMIRFIKEFAEQARAPGWPGLLIGDISQPRGGPMLSGHRSHQVGLDVDIRYEAKPNRPLSAYERATISGYRLAGPRDTEVNENWKRGHERVLRIAAKDPRVQRILTHPSVKKKLCETVRGDRSWLRKVRPVFGHNYHFHIRLFCPRGTPGCRSRP
ncbi:MAG: penicillin-insensitive murein endopeptidase [Pseudomonadota bacterium]